MKTPFSLFCLLGLFWLIALGCQNLFNPDGAVDSDELDASALVEYGEQLLAKTRYQEAYTVFDQALAKDSSLSLAYYGKVKSVLRIHQVNPLSLTSLAVTSSADGEEKDPMQEIGDLFESGEFENLTPFIEMNAILSEFFRRDSINFFYTVYHKNLSLDPLDVQIQKQYEQFKIDFIEKKNTQYQDNDFPLMDRILEREDLDLSFQMAQIVVTMGQVHQLIGGGDQFSEDLNKLISGEKKLSEIQTFRDAVNDSSKAIAHNQKIDDIANGTNDIHLTPELLGLETDSLNPNKEVKIQKSIDALGESIVFYKIADQKDNDGDGCIDEELYDGVDNDLDGLIDEDVRRFEDDRFDNDRDNEIDNNFERLNPDDSILLYATANSEYKMNDLYQNDSMKLEIALDTLFAKYSLNYRIEHIGGCWK